jgi:hypothetical protein
VLTVIRDVLSNLSKEIQWFEDFEVAFGRVGPPVLEGKRIRMIRVVDDVILRGTPGDLGFGDRAWGDVFEKAGESLLVSRVNSHLFMNTETGVLTLVYLLCQLRFDATVVNQQPEDVVFPDLEERFRRHIRQGVEPRSSSKAP